MGQALSTSQENEKPDFSVEIALSSTFSIDDIIATAEDAGKAILGIYNSDPAKWEVEAKSDNSPLTLADREANTVICNELQRLTPHIPIVSEETALLSYDVRQRLQYFWLVDPLDGTKEFIKRNGEFTVNIALVSKGQPVLGVVHVPVTGKTYWALQGKGAWLRADGQQTRLMAAEFSLEDPGLRLVGSSSHMSKETEEFMQLLQSPSLVQVGGGAQRLCSSDFLHAWLQALWHMPECLQVGSSLKLLMVAEGAAHIYPRLAPTCEWDTAAADVIVREAGGVVLQAGRCDSKGKSLEDWKEALMREEKVVYGKEDMLNPFFIVFGRKRLQAGDSI